MEIQSTKETSSTTKPLAITGTSTDSSNQSSNTDGVVKTGGFEDFMKSALTGMGKSEVSEEELFASLIEQRLGEVSPEAAEFYSAEKAKLMTSMAKPNGHIPMEDVALQALNATVASGKITEADGTRINGEAFMGAQLDSDMENLFDDKGGENDPTKAVASVDEAMNKLKLFMDSMKAGTLKSEARPLGVGATGSQLLSSASASATASGEIGSGAVGGSQNMDGPGGFVWKPESDSDGNLVVLLPTELRGHIGKVEIHSSLPPTEATKLGEGKFSGDEDNGARPHFRFSKPGKEYGDNIHVVAYKNDGTTATWAINNGGQRHD
jgi:hypothetical protein